MVGRQRSGWGSYSLHRRRSRLLFAFVAGGCRGCFDDGHVLEPLADAALLAFVVGSTGTVMAGAHGWELRKFTAECLEVLWFTSRTAGAGATPAVFSLEADHAVTTTA